MASGEQGSAGVYSAGPASELDIPEDRRKAAEAHVRLLAESARKAAMELPLQADECDFQRILEAEARP